MLESAFNIEAQYWTFSELNKRVEEKFEKFKRAKLLNPNQRQKAEFEACRNFM